ncbi:MAG: FeoA family protein [Bacteroidota bacterium]
MSAVHTRQQTAQQTPDLQLSGLKAGERGQIIRIDNSDLELALLKMGVAVEDFVSFAGEAPFKGPIMIRVAQTKLSLRREDAQKIWINRR